jgi:hypothetical protein
MSLALFAARCLLLCLLHIINHHLPHQSTRKTSLRLPPPSAATAMPDPGGISRTSDEPREYPQQIWNHRLPSRGRGGRGGPPPRIDPHRVSGGASPQPAIALRGHRGLDLHRVCCRRPRRLHRHRPTTGGISLEESPHHPHVLAHRVQLRVRCHVVQDRVMGGGV